MRMNKETSFLTAVALSCSLLLGACGGGGDPTPTRDVTNDASTTTDAVDGNNSLGADNGSNFTELGSFPIVREKENIIVYLAASNAEFNPETNWMTAYYEDKTNVSVTWKMSSLEQFKEKISLAFAGGEQLDLVIAGGSNTTGYSMTEVLKLANQGVILPLEELFETDSIYFTQCLDTVEGWREILTTPDGHIYSLPTMTECYHCMYYGKMWVNTIWLDNLGLDIPTTVDDFRDMLIAFRDNDANGNGDPNDEIPMMGAIDSYGAKIDTYLMSAFIYDDGENRLFLEGGDVTAAFVQPEFQEGLKYLNGLFEEDLIYKESFTQTRDIRNKVNSQNYESMAGVIPNIHHGIGSREAGQPVRWIDYEPIVPLVGPNGLQVTRYNYYDKFQTDKPAGFIPDTCSNPELVVRWLDWFMSEEGTHMLRYGEEDLGWKTADEGATGVDGRPATYKSVALEPESKYYGNLTWGQEFPNYFSAAHKMEEQQPADMRAEDGSGLEKFLFTKSRENYAPYAASVDQLIPPMYYDAEIISEVATLTTNINTYVEESIARFIIGDMSVENDWDNYLTQLNNLGLPRYLEIIQETYDKSAFASQ